MPDYDIDPKFEQRLAGHLQELSDEGIVPYDAMEITTMVTRTSLPEDAQEILRQARADAHPPQSRSFVRPALAVALLALLLVAVAIAGGLIKLPS
jgi:hypothetical protein